MVDVSNELTYKLMLEIQAGQEALTHKVGTIATSCFIEAPYKAQAEPPRNFHRRTVMENARPVSAEELAAFLSKPENEITKCPDACVLPTHATIDAAHRAGLTAYSEQQNDKIKRRPFNRWIRNPASRERHAEAVRQGKQRHITRGLG